MGSFPFNLKKNQRWKICQYVKTIMQFMFNLVLLSSQVAEFDEISV